MSRISARLFVFTMEIGQVLFEFLGHIADLLKVLLVQDRAIELFLVGLLGESIFCKGDDSLEN